jgi:hypothetical protein
MTSPKYVQLMKSYGRLQWQWRLIYALSPALILISSAMSVWEKGAGFWGVGKGTVWVPLLFLIPVIVQLISVHFLSSRLEGARERYRENRDHRDDNVRYECEKDFESLIAFSKFYLRTMSLCLFSYSFLWLMYVCGEKSYKWEVNLWDIKEETRITGFYGYFFLGLSFAAMIFVALLLYRVIIMTHAIIAGAVASQEAERKAQLANPDPEGLAHIDWLKHDYLKRGASHASFLALLFFVTIFLGVSFLLAFALAFHDKTRPPGEPALVMRNQVTPAAAPLPSPPQTSIANSSPTPLATFHFDSGTAALNFSGSEEELKKVSDEINRDTEDNNPVRVTITGSADLRQIESRAYQSNYELAEARAHQIKQKLMTSLSFNSPGWDNEPRNIEWVCLSAPKEGIKEVVSKRPPGYRQAVAEENPNDRVVWVTVERKFEEPNSIMARHMGAAHPNALSLMDYVYFANYTITTTGYGDIIPNTAYTKFICSFANICEVFFLVVLFNSLLSLRGNRSEHEMPHKIEEMSPKVKDLHEEYVVKMRGEGLHVTAIHDPPDGVGK